MATGIIGIRRAVPLIVILLLASAGMAQLDPAVERWLFRLEQNLSEAQQRLLAERLLVVRVPMVDLLDDYQANEITADQIYKGNKVEFAGRILEVGISESILRDRGLYLVLDPPDRPHLLTIRCGFARSKRDELVALQQGQVVIVQGELRYKREDIIQINDCSLFGEQE